MTAIPEVSNLDLYVYNDTNNNIDAVINEQFNGNLVDDASKYSMAITRFHIPINSAELMKIIVPSDPDYAITIESNVLHTALGADIFQSGVGYMDVGSIMPIYTPSDFVESCNRTIARAWTNLIDGSNDFSSFVEIDTTNNAPFQTAGSLNSTTSIALTSTTTYAVQLTISNFNVVATAGSEVPLVNIDLTNAVGSKVRVASSIILEPSNSYTFKIGGNLDQSNVGTSLDSKYSYLPKETFLKFSDQQTNGNWTLTISPCGENSLNVTASWTLGVYKPPSHSTDSNRYALPNLLPNISLDSSGYFTWTVHEKFLRSGMRIKLGSKIANILSLSKNSFSNYVEFPISLFSTGLNEVVSFKAESPKLYAINRIMKIHLSSNTLPLSKDYSNNSIASSAITSFDVPGDQLEQFTYASYSTDAGVIPLRRYKFQSQASISVFNLDFSVQYADGSIQKLQLKPGEYMSVLVSLFKDA